MPETAIRRCALVAVIVVMASSWPGRAAETRPAVGRVHQAAAGPTDRVGGGAVPKPPPADKVRSRSLTPTSGTRRGLVLAGLLILLSWLCRPGRASAGVEDYGPWHCPIPSRYPIVVRGPPAAALS